MMNKDQGAGIFERLIYSAVLFLAMKAVQRGYIDSDMATYLAVTAMGLPAVIFAWWHNRPASVLSRGGDTLPPNAKLVITTTPDASQMEKAEVHALANAASDKVIADTDPQSKKGR